MDFCEIKNKLNAFLLQEGRTPARWQSRQNKTNRSPTVYSSGSDSWDPRWSKLHRVCHAVHVIGSGQLHRSCCCSCTCSVVVYGLLRSLCPFANSLSGALLRDSSPVTWWQAWMSPREPSILGLNFNWEYLSTGTLLWPLTGPSTSCSPWARHAFETRIWMTVTQYQVQLSVWGAAQALSGSQLCVLTLRKHLPEFFSSLMLVLSYYPLTSWL